ncbi:hypothetical protein Tco_0057949 [Tanacetum coccineum]
MADNEVKVEVRDLHWADLYECLVETRNGLCAKKNMGSRYHGSPKILKEHLERQGVCLLAEVMDVNEGKHSRTSSSKERGNDKDMIQELGEEYMVHLERAYSIVFVGDIYGDHDVSCAGIIGIKHHHNVVCDTFVDIYFCSGISVGKEVDIGLDGGVTNHYVQQICYFTRWMEDIRARAAIRIFNKIRFAIAKGVEPR